MESLAHIALIPSLFSSHSSANNITILSAVQKKDQQAPSLIALPHFLWQPTLTTTPYEATSTCTLHPKFPQVFSTAPIVSLYILYLDSHIQQTHLTKHVRAAELFQLPIISSQVLSLLCTELPQFKHSPQDSPKHMEG